MAKSKRKNTQNPQTPLWLVLLVVLLVVGLYFFKDQLYKNRVPEPDLTELNDHRYLLPKGVTGDQTVEHLGYTLSYDEETEQAEWVMYRITDKQLYQGKARRTDNFREDPSVTSGSATLEDYTRSGYDRGHLAPAADFKWSDSAMSSTFYFSNMSPQLPGFNRGIWKELEEKTRDQAKQDHELYVVTGPIFKNATTTIGPNEVTVPTHYFKVLLDIYPPEYKAIGYIFEHEKTKKPLRHFAVSIDSVESFTGIDLFPALPDSVETPLEADFNIHKWITQ